MPFRSMLALMVLVNTALPLMANWPAPSMAIGPLLVQGLPVSVTVPVMVVAALVVSTPVPAKVMLGRSSAWLMVSAPLPPSVPPPTTNDSAVPSKVRSEFRLSVPPFRRSNPAPLIADTLLVPPLTTKVEVLAMVAAKLLVPPLTIKEALPAISTAPGAAPLPLSSDSDPAWTFRVPVLLKTRAGLKFWVVALVLVMVMVPELLKTPKLPPASATGVVLAEAMVRVPALSRREPPPPRLWPIRMALVPFRSMLALMVLVNTALPLMANWPAPSMAIGPLLVQGLPVSVTVPVMVVAALVVSTPVPVRVVFPMATVPLNVILPAPVSVAVLNTAGPATVMSAPPPSVPLVTVTTPSVSAALFVSCPLLMVSGPVIDDGPASVSVPGPLMVIASSLRNWLACCPATSMVTTGFAAPRSMITMSAAVGSRFLFQLDASVHDPLLSVFQKSTGVGFPPTWNTTLLTSICWL